MTNRKTVLSGSSSLMMTTKMMTTTTTMMMMMMTSSMFTSALDVRLPPSLSSQSDGLRYFVDGMDLDFVCIAHGYPQPTIHWLKDDQPIDIELHNPLEIDHLLSHHHPQSHHFHHFSTMDNSTTLRISTTISSDAGRYKCVVQNDHGRLVSSPMTLVMTYLGREDGEGDDQQGVVKKFECRVGSHCILRCMLNKSQPKLIYQWFHKGTEVLSNGRTAVNDLDGTLHISNVIVSDDGEVYTCHGSNGILDEYIKKELSIVVVGASPATLPPSPPQLQFSPQSHLIVLEGKDITLKCFFSGLPTPKVTWVKLSNNNHLNVNNIHNNNNNILNNNHNDNVHNNKNNHDNISVINHNDVIHEGIEYRLTSLTPQDNSKYMCTGVNDVGVSRFIVDLKVESAPIFKHPDHRPHDYNVTQGDDLTIPCNVYSIPPANITWYKDGRVFNLTSKKYQLSKDKRHLTIKNLCKSCKHTTTPIITTATTSKFMNGSGRYSDLSIIQCQGRNEHGEVWASAYVNVLERTRITMPPLSQEVDQDSTDNVTFTCSGVADDSTPISISWYHHDDDDNKFPLSPSDEHDSHYNNYYYNNYKYTDNNNNNNNNNNSNYLNIHKRNFNNNSNNDKDDDDTNIHGKITITNNNRTLIIERYINDTTWWKVHVGRYSCLVTNGYSHEEKHFRVFFKMADGYSALLKASSPFMLLTMVILITLLLLLLMLLLWLFCCCYFKRKGATYSVDEKERQNGNNPEQELEWGGFHDYRRPESKLKTSHLSLISSGISMGNASIAEYDDYEPSKYDEDGSFIGNYRG